MTQWIPDSDVEECVERLERMLGEPTFEARRAQRELIIVFADRTVREGTLWCRAVQVLRERGTIVDDSALFLISVFWESVASFEASVDDPEMQRLEAEKRAIERRLGLPSDGKIDIYPPEHLALADQWSARLDELEARFYRDLGEDRLAAVVRDPKAYEGVRKRGAMHIFGPPDPRGSILREESPDPSPQVAACMGELRRVHRSRSQWVELKKLVYGDGATDDWFEAIQQLRAEGELDRAQAHYLLEQFAAQIDDDADLELERLQREIVSLDAGSEESNRLISRASAREAQVHGAHFRSVGETEQADLLERDPGAYWRLFDEGYERLAGDGQVDLFAPEANAAPAGAPRWEVPLEHESVAVRWCVDEIRYLLLNGFKRKSDFEQTYENTAPVDAWFHAIKRLRADGELDDPRATFLFDWSAAQARHRGPNKDPELARLQEQVLGASLDDDEDDEDGDDDDDALVKAFLERGRTVISGYYRRMGEDALAKLYERRRGDYDALVARGEKALKRPPPTP